MKKVTKVYLGVDVSKKWLDVHCNPINKVLRVSNDVQGVTGFLQKLVEYKVVQVVFESSGGYEYLLHRMLDKTGYNTWQVDPSRVKAFRVSEGIRVKTDACDAKILALFAKHKKRAYKVKKASDKMLKLRALVLRRETLTTIIANEKKRLAHPYQQHCKKDIESHITFIKKQTVSMDKKIGKIIDEDDELKRKKEIITSIPGVGNNTASSLIANMQELGQINNKQVAALLGVAPYQRQSGMYVGTAHIQGGRHTPRHMLYMAALTASRCNSIFFAFYQRLLAAGKKPKVALVAIMRKIITVINVMIKKDEVWKLS